MEIIFGLIVFVMIGFIFHAYKLWYKYGRDVKLSKREFKNISKPIEGISLLKMGMIYRKEMLAKDVIALIYEFANEGYLKIENYIRKIPWGKEKAFRLIKIKDYEKDTNNEEFVIKKVFFDKLFENRNEVTSKELLVSSFALKISGIKSLYSQLYDRIKESKIYKESIDVNDNENMGFVDNRRKIFKSSLIFLYTYFIAQIVYMIILKTFIPVQIIPFFLIFQIMCIRIAIFKQSKSTVILNAIIVYPILVIFPILGSNLIFYSSEKLTLNQLIINLVISFIFNVLLIIIINIGRAMSRRTQDEQDNYYKIKTFKDTLKNMSKKELEMHIIENPNYYYEMIPYAYSFGIIKNWANKLSYINISSPDWYIGMYDFKKFMKYSIGKIDAGMRCYSASRGYNYIE